MEPKSVNSAPWYTYFLIAKPAKSRLLGKSQILWFWALWTKLTKTLLLRQMKHFYSYFRSKCSKPHFFGQKIFLFEIVIFCGKLLKSTKNYYYLNWKFFFFFILLCFSQSHVFPTNQVTSIKKRNNWFDFWRNCGQGSKVSVGWRVLPQRSYEMWRKFRYSLILTLLINQKLFDSFLEFLKIEIFIKKFFLLSNFKTRFVRGPLSTRNKTSKY